MGCVIGELYQLLAAFAAQQHPQLILEVLELPAPGVVSIRPRSVGWGRKYIQKRCSLGAWPSTLPVREMVRVAMTRSRSKSSLDDLDLKGNGGG